MKHKLLFLLTGFSFVFFFGFAQSKFTYGKVSRDELSMSIYEKDTSAVAVVLYEKGYTSYEYSSTVGFRVNTELERRIKVLKQEGVKYADVSIPYYVKGKQKEGVFAVEAISYNQENGKTIKSKLEKKYIFDEQVSEYNRQTKFSIPNVKVGTVIEYKYRKISPFYLSIPSWRFQGNIPVQCSIYEVLIPEYLIFNVDASKGSEYIQVTDEYENQKFNIGYYENGQSATVTSNSRSMTFTALDVPALIVEPYVWCVDDHISEVSFEISGTHFPNDFYRPYMTTWNSIEQTLIDETDFGKNLNISNPYKEEVKQIVAMNQNEEEVIHDIFALMKAKLRWNDTYAFWGNNTRSAVKNGIGDNSQLNMILISMLRDAGIKAYPVLVNLRSQGRIPYTHPSIDKLNSFVVAAETTDGKCFYMDGSARYGGLNMLPLDMQIDRAWAFREDVNADTWVDLSCLTSNKQQVSMNLSFDEANGLMACERNVRYSGQFAYDFKNNFYSHTDSASFVEKLESANGIAIENYSLQGVEALSDIVEEKVSFTKKYDLTGNYMYLNPLIFNHIEKNPFIQSERKLPIEFDYPYTYTQTVLLNIPESYIVEELPEALSIMLPEQAGVCFYQVKHINEKLLQVMYRFELKKLVFLPVEYAVIKDFFGQIAAKNIEPIVLKKL